MAAERTIAALWRDGTSRPRSTPAYLVERDGAWSPVSWDQAAERVSLLANGLLSRGVEKGQAFGILAATTVEWALFDFALAHVGAIGAAVYANSSPADVAYVLEPSEPRTPGPSRRASRRSTRTTCSRTSTRRARPGRQRRA